VVRRVRRCASQSGEQPWPARKTTIPKKRLITGTCDGLRSTQRARRKKYQLAACAPTANGGSKRWCRNSDPSHAYSSLSGTPMPASVSRSPCCARSSARNRIEKVHDGRRRRRSFFDRRDQQGAGERSRLHVRSYGERVQLARVTLIQLNIEPRGRPTHDCSSVHGSCWINAGCPGSTRHSLQARHPPGRCRPSAMLPED